MAKNRFVEEINIVRGLSALAVVSMHSINTGNYKSILPYFEKGLLFATPTFLFISAFLIFYTYQSKPPNNFLKKRVKYIILPYIFWSSTYTVIYSLKYHNKLPTIFSVIENIFLAKYHIYFIFIIFQFYLLFVFIHKFKLQERLLRKRIVILAFIFNLIYLAVFTHTNSPYELFDQFWHRYYYLIFPGWIFYFFLGAFIAKHFLAFKRFLLTHRIKLYTLSLAAAFLVMFLLDRPVTSKRPEILLYSTLLLPSLFLFSFKKGRLQELFKFFSKYSFGIYLSHPLFYILFHDYYEGLNPLLTFAVHLFLQLGGGIVLTTLFSHFKYGYLFIGKLQRTSSKTQDSSKPFSIPTEHIEKSVAH